MYATIRTYAGSPQLADELASRQQDIEDVLTPVEGFKGWYLVKTDDACMTITLTSDERGADESSRAAAEWFREQGGDISAPSPQIAKGEIVLTLGATATV